MTIFILGGLLFFLAGGELRQIILFCIVALVAGWLVVQFSTTGQARLASYLAGLKDPLKSSSHVLWSLEAVYKGRWFGVGIGQCHHEIDRPALCRHRQYLRRGGRGTGPVRAPWL